MTTFYYILGLVVALIILKYIIEWVIEIRIRKQIEYRISKEITHEKLVTARLEMTLRASMLSVELTLTTSLILLSSLQGRNCLSLNRTTAARSA